MQNVLKICTVLLVANLSLCAAEASNEISISYVGMSMDYREYDRSDNILDSEMSELDEIKGIEIGIKHFFNHQTSSYDEINFNYMNISGPTEYVGSILGSGQPYGSLISRTENDILDVDIGFKRHHIVQDNLELYYGLSIGYRLWERALSAFQVEDYYWYSLRPSIGGKYEVFDKITIGANIEYQYGLDPVMKLSNPSLEFDLGAANIIEVSIPIKYEYSQTITFLLEPVYQYQDIVESNVVSGFYEPKSTAKNEYLKMGIVFKF